MSKQELYAWISLASTVALLGLYILLAWRLPDGAAAYADALKEAFIKVIVIAFVVELVLELSRYTRPGRVDKDERDRLIEGKSYRNAYFFLMIAIVAMLGNILVSDLISEATGERMFMAIPFMTFHALLVILFVASITRSATQLFYYRTGT